MITSTDIYSCITSIGNIYIVSCSNHGTRYIKLPKISYLAYCDMEVCLQVLAVFIWYAETDDGLLSKHHLHWENRHREKGEKIFCTFKEFSGSESRLFRTHILVASCICALLKTLDKKETEKVKEAKLCINIADMITVFFLGDAIRRFWFSMTNIWTPTEKWQSDAGQLYLFSVNMISGLAKSVFILHLIASKKYATK